jgi:hypothetical protein
MPRTYTAEEQVVMRELNVSKLTNIFSGTISTGAMRWRVKLCAEGLLRKTRELHGKSLLMQSGRHLWALICRVLMRSDCLMRHCFGLGSMCDHRA